ncbi:MAG: proton-conducting transporter membrane subunit [Candidatus Omnitrophica bacterium]|nr:proton-conducting transporter membrane subunit [Candidatus Omnitrophota bacterium]
MTNISLFFLLTLPLLSGICFFFLGRLDNLRKNISLGVLLFSLIYAIIISLSPHFAWSKQIFPGFTVFLTLDKLSRLVLVFANLFGFLICLFSKDYSNGKGGYFSWLILLMVFTNLEILATDFIVFTLSWGGSIFILYMLLNLNSKFSAKKAGVILGFSYLCFIAGAIIYTSFTGSNSMFTGSTMILNRPVCWVAIVLMLIGALAKAGSGPLHTWIPTASQSAPATVMAILPASLDKLLGIYILSRICLDFFVMNNFIIGLLLITGSLTIIFAVMMALIQHDLRKLLSYHAISQVGYMVLGIGTATPIGIIGAIFHMINNSIYKSGLFLVGGAVEKKANTFELDRLGGLARYMPLTFLAAIVFSLSISGIPPLNGFASKWMLYQGAFLGLLATTNICLRFIYMFALVAAMFGSALTLASFIKFIHAIFLGQDNLKSKEKIGEASWEMLVPLLTLAAFCVMLGVFANYFVGKFIAPSFSFILDYSGSWNSIFVSVFIIMALVIGFIIWNSMNKKGVREDTFFVGGESGYSRPLFPATEFYKTIENLPLLRIYYRFLKSEDLDIYNILTLKWIFKRKNKNAKT